jgi:hypothetical protein
LGPFELGARKGAKKKRKEENGACSENARAWKKEEENVSKPEHEKEEENVWKLPFEHANLVPHDIEV